MPSGRGYTVTYDGVASTSLDGFMCHEVTRGLVAERRTNFDSVPGREGSFVFPEEPGMRVVELDCSVLVDAVDPALRRAAVRKVAAWYNRPTLRKLLISDEPGVYEMAIPADAPNVTEWRQRGSFVLPFLCEPYSYDAAVTTTTKVMAGATDVLVVQNDGDVRAPFIVEILASGSPSSQHVAANDRTWTRDLVLSNGNRMHFNTVSGTVHSGANYDTNIIGRFETATLTMADVSGRPPFLEPGANNVEVGASAGSTVNIYHRNRHS